MASLTHSGRLILRTFPRLPLSPMRPLTIPLLNRRDLEFYKLSFSKGRREENSQDRVIPLAAY